jgi:hypothetical protein
MAFLLWRGDTMVRIHGYRVPYEHGCPQDLLYFKKHLNRIL